jgi:hypothetical protein
MRLFHLVYGVLSHKGKFSVGGQYSDNPTAAAAFSASTAAY